MYENPNPLYILIVHEFQVFGFQKTEWTPLPILFKHYLASHSIVVVASEKLEHDNFPLYIS
jgi:hypothetical protein